jgi:hypothetical protein
MRGRSAGDKTTIASHQQEREEQACEARKPREHAALGEQLNRHAAPTGPERGTQRDLTGPACGSRQQEVRDVGARDEPHDGDGAHQRPQGRLSIARDPLLQRSERHGLFARFSGCWRARLSPMVRICALALASSTPGFSRPTA